MSVWPHGDTHGGIAIAHNVSVASWRHTWRYSYSIAGPNVQMGIDVRLTEYRLQIIASDIKVDNR